MPVNAIIIGAAKAGTTSLFNILGHHVEVCAASTKETRFFSDDARFARGLGWYAQEYFGHAVREPVWLEASPAYLTWSDKVAPRIRASLAAPRFIAVFRDPVRRAYSHYWHRVRLGHEPLSFAEAVAQEGDRLRTHWDALSRAGNGKFGYVRAGCYATRLRPFLDRFDRSQFCFLLQEDLEPARCPATVARLLQFLDIDSSVTLPQIHVNAPTRARHPGLTTLYWRLKRTALRPLYVGIVPRPVRQAVLGALFPSTTYPPMPADVERALRIRYADEVQACAAMIGRDLSHWLPT